MRIALDRPSALDRAECLAMRGTGHHAEHRHAVFHQADADGEIVAPGGEFAGAVQRIDEPEPRRLLGNAACGHLFLGDDGNLRHGGTQGGDDNRLCLVIGRCHQRIIGLVHGLEAALADGENGLTGAGGKGEGEFEKIFMGHVSA